MWRIKTTFSGPNVVGGGINYLYFNDAAGSPEDAQSAVVNFWTIANDAYRVDTVASVSNEVAVMDLSGSITGVLTAGDNVNINGTDDSDPLPPATQCLVRLRTGVFVAGREVRGRIFIPSGGEALSVGGKPGGGRLTELQTAVGGLVGDINSTLVVFSRTHGVAPPVSSGSVWNQFAVLRSRRD